MNENMRGRKWKTMAAGAAAISLLGLAACGDDDGLSAEAVAVANLVAALSARAAARVPAATALRAE